MEETLFETTPESPFSIENTPVPDMEQENLKQKLILAAQEAKERNDYENMMRHYEELRAIDANDWEANFYILYCKVMNHGFSNVTESVGEIQAALPNIVMMIRDYVSDGKKMVATKEVVDKTSDLVLELSGQVRNQYFDVSTELRDMFTAETKAQLDSVRHILYDLGLIIEDIMPGQLDNAVLSWKMGVSMASQLHHLADETEKVEAQNEFLVLIRKYDENYMKVEHSIYNTLKIRKSGKPEDKHWALIVWGICVIAALYFLSK